MDGGRGARQASLAPGQATTSAAAQFSPALPARGTLAPMYDAVVVGGGLAGATTAYHLAVAGRQVLLLERSETYRRKACGEGMFPRGVRELRRLGLLDEVRSQGSELTGVRFHSESTQVEAPFGPGMASGLGIQRTELDHRVLEHARTAGVDVRTGVTVRGLYTAGSVVTGLETSGGAVAARVVVAADGIGSRLRVQSGLDRPHRGDRYGVSAHVRVDHDPGSLVDVYFHGGYEVYVTPVGGPVVNVAVLAKKRLLGEAHGDLPTWFKGMISRATSEFGADVELLDPPLAAGPFGSACVRPWRRNLVLVGDAAGFFDAINGEGMSLTLVSARDCAAAVSDYLERHDEAAFRRYGERRRALVRNAELLARLSVTLAARPRIARHAIGNMARRPRAFARLVAISAGELPMRALRPSDVRALMIGR